MALSFSCCHKSNPNRGTTQSWESEQQQQRQQQEVWLLQLSSSHSEIAEAWLQDMAFWEIQTQVAVSSSATAITENSATDSITMGNSHHGHNHNNNSKNQNADASQQPVIGGSNGNQQLHPLDHRHSSTASDIAAASNSRTLQRRSSTESTGSKGSTRSKQRTYSSGNNSTSGDTNEDEFQLLQQQRLMEYYQETGQQPPSQAHIVAAVAAMAATAAEPPPPVWKTAVDPNTGRTYYYDLVTRRTQWEKPAELRAWERRKKAEKRQRDAQFFRDMECNILASLARGEMVPGVVDLIKTGPPREPFLASPTNQTSSNNNNNSNAANAKPFPEKRVRTISSMEDAVVLAALRHEGYSEQSGTQTTTSQPGTASSHPPLPRSQASSTSGAAASGLSVNGRPPLPTAARRNGYQQQQNNRQQQVDDELDSPLSDSMELSPDMHTHTAFYESDGLLAGEHLLDGPISEDVMVLNQAGGLNSMNGNSNDASTTAKNGQSNSATTATSSNSHYRRNTGGTIYLKSTMSNPNVIATIQCVCGVYRAHIVQAWEQEQQQQHSPISVMSNSSANSKGEGDAMSRTHATNKEIFRDDYGSDLYYNRYSHPTTPVAAQTSNQLPALSDIIAFYQAFYEKSQMEHDTIIMSLIYVERLIKETNGVLSPTYSNWRSVLFSCMVLASKVWDDLSMWNIDFSNVSAHIQGLSSFTLSRINELEVALLTSLSFNVKVPASEYAKYYFLIRTMLLRSGLLPDEGAAAEAKAVKNSKGPNAVYFNNLEMKTMAYQDSKFPMNPRAHALPPPARGLAGAAAARNVPKPEPSRLRAKSMDDYFWVWLQQQKQQQQSQQQKGGDKLAAANAAAPSSVVNVVADTSSWMPRRRLGPVLQENICMEQLVSMKG